MRNLVSLMEWEKRRRDYITMLGVDDAENVDDDDDGVDEYDDDYVDDGTTPSSPRSVGTKGAFAEQGESLFFSRRKQGTTRGGGGAPIVDLLQPPLVPSLDMEDRTH